MAAVGSSRRVICVEMRDTFLMEIYTNNRAINFWKVLKIFALLTLLDLKQKKLMCKHASKIDYYNAAQNTKLIVNLCFIKYVC